MMQCCLLCGRVIPQVWFEDREVGEKRRLQKFSKVIKPLLFFPPLVLYQLIEMTRIGSGCSLTEVVKSAP